MKSAHVTKAYRAKISRRMKEVWAARCRVKAALREIEENRKREHCCGSYCRYLAERRCMCLCAPCGEAKKRDH